MSITEQKCITLRCDECREPFAYDDITVHWDVDDRVEMRNNAADADWGITDEGEWCPSCWARKVCERFGHVPALDVRGEFCDRCEEKAVNHWGFCDRCGAMTEFPCWKVRVCYSCELGMNSIGAALNPPWSRAMTSSEVWLAHQWAVIEHGQPERGRDVSLPGRAS